ncbi:hypothetical protein PpBr36_01670 [Pyricularia pennisetigena]|uniref:hypothetical protein n=1 Tax=Pyricularia pennisetigena TaxID=1578925 RepID=UPI00114DC204|nr:hypothetical protein PpBr36_01670 [Pyricularia pennisetigena]TLS29160.1 hypothetical protein PpBr36_01670 [Pyricularia pennisetigena]
MSPSPSMSAHWGKQIYASWRQSRQGSGATTTTAPSPVPSPLASPAGFPEKRSMDSDRSSTSGSVPITRQLSNSSWFGRR